VASTDSKGLPPQESLFELRGQLRGPPAAPCATAAPAKSVSPSRPSHWFLGSTASQKGKRDGNGRKSGRAPRQSLEFRLQAGRRAVQTRNPSATAGATPQNRDGFPANRDCSQKSATGPPQIVTGFRETVAGLRNPVTGLRRTLTGLAETVTGPRKSRDASAEKDDGRKESNDNSAEQREELLARRDGVGRYRAGSAAESFPPAPPAVASARTPRSERNAIVTKHTLTAACMVGRRTPRLLNRAARVASGKRASGPGASCAEGRERERLGLGPAVSEARAGGPGSGCAKGAPVESLGHRPGSARGKRQG
jgi:hypothetical protein